VWEVDGEVLAALHLRAGKRGYLVRTLLHPDALEQVEALGRAALNLTILKPDLPVYFAVRQYEAGWPNVLPELGFAPLGSQALVVRHMAVRVRGKMPTLMKALEQSPTEGAAPSAISQSARTAGKKAGQNGRGRRSGRKILNLL
jgi:hypothetical protein